MADITFHMDTSSLEKAVKDMQSWDKELQAAAQLLSAQAHAHMVELAQQRLHSRRQMFLDALVGPIEVEPGVFMLKLDASMAWIDDGLEPFDMVDTLLHQTPGAFNAKTGGRNADANGRPLGSGGYPKNSAKTASDGSQYRVIPFEHKKGPTRSTMSEQTLTAALKKELKQLKIPYQKIETNADGSPKLGLVHSNLQVATPNRPEFATASPNKAGDAGRPNQHGFGQGKIGEPMRSGGGTPFLQGVNIYQRLARNPDGSAKVSRKGEQVIERSILTFRVVSSKHKGQKWQHPGMEGTHIFDDTLRWLEQQWQQETLPALAKKLGLVDS